MCRADIARVTLIAYHRRHLSGSASSERRGGHHLKSETAHLKRPLIIAHRGASVAEPENTLRAFAAAIRQGAGMIELDLQVTRDGQVIVLHDETLDRTTNMTGRAEAMSFAEIRRADAGKGERVPSLQETLDLARNRVRLYLEIKDARAGAETLRIVRAMNCENEVMIASFDSELMRTLGREVQDIELGLIIGQQTFDPRVRWREAFPWLAFRAINYHVLSVWDEICFSAVVTHMHKRHKRVYVWTVDSDDDFGRMIARGVDGICTNVPDRLLAYLQQNELRTN